MTVSVCQIMAGPGAPCQIRHCQIILTLTSNYPHFDILEEYSRLQAQYGITDFFSHDGTRQFLPPAVAPPDGLPIVARASVRHDGVVLSGRLEEHVGADNYIAELAAQVDTAWSLDRGRRVALVFDATSPPQAMLRFARVCDRWRQGYYVGEWLDTLLRLLERCEVVVLIWQRSHVGGSFNEWVDLLADSAALDGDEVPVRLVERPSFTSLSSTICRRSPRVWAIPLAVREVHSRLAAAVDSAQFRSDADLPAVPLSDEEWLTCQAVLGERSVVGDAKRQRGAVCKAELANVACPFGCQRREGGPAAFTWLHAQVFCCHPELVEPRREWVKGVAAVEGLMTNDAAPTPQLVLSKAVIREGIPRTRGGAPAKEHALAPYVEVKLRRLAGGLFECSGEKKIDGSKEMAALVRATTVAGVGVQLKARELTAELEEAVSRERRLAQRVEKLARLWRRHTRESGPERIAALRRVAEAAAAVVSRSGQLKLRGAIDEDTAAAHEDEVRVRLVRAIAVVRSSFPRRGEHAYGDWRRLALMSRWRLKAALRGRYEREARLVRLVSTASKPHVFGTFENKRVRLGVRGEEGGSAALLESVYVDQRATAWLQDIVETKRVPTATVRLPIAQVGERPAAFLHPACCGLLGKEQRAQARWEAGGGMRGERKRRALAAKALAQKRLLATQREMAKYVRQGDGRAAYGLSGQRLSDVGERVHVEIEPRGRARRQRKRRAASARAVARTAQRTGFDDGSAPNAHGKWKVDRVLEVRRVTAGDTAGGSRKLEARLRWHGGPKTGPAAGLPWPDDWREVGRGTMTEALYNEARAMESVRFGTQLRATAATAGSSDRVPGSRRSRRHFDANDEHLPMPPPRRRRQGLELDEAANAPAGGALGFLRACEAAAAAAGARRRGTR